MGINTDGRVSMNARDRVAQRGKEDRRKAQYLGSRPQRRVKDRESFLLRRGLVLRGHTAAHGHTGILATCLLLLEVLIVGHLLLLLVGHVAGVHARTGHVSLGRVDVGVILGGLGWDLGSIDTILAGGGIGGIQASLDGS